MSSFRNIDMSPDPSVKQGSRIVHPMYARYAVKDSRGSGEDVQKTLSESNRNITPTNFPVNVRLCNRLRSFDQVQAVPSNTSNKDKSGYYTQTFPMPSDGHPEQKESDRTVRDGVEIKNSDSSPTSEHMAMANDNITEKNKKSSIEQKRFYQRKLSGFSPIKLLPVGKLFKFLRPPLQRRNSCPALSISEIEAEARLNQVAARRNPDTDTKQSQPVKVTNDQNRSCRLTKWTSHQELQRREKDKCAQNNSSEELETNCKVRKYSSFKVPTNRTFGIEPDLSTSNSQPQNAEANLLSIRDSNNQGNVLKRKDTDSPVIEKTVIIVSESSTIIPNESVNPTDADSKQSEQINATNGVSISMSSTLHDYKSENSSRNTSNQTVNKSEISSIQKLQGSNITILSSESVQSASNSNSHHIQLKNSIDQPGNTSSEDDKTNQYFQACEKGNINSNSLNTEGRDYSNDVNNKILLKFQNIERELDNAIAESNFSSANTGDKAGKGDSHYIRIDDTTEYIRITPSKANNILYTHDTINRSFSTFKSEPNTNTTIAIENSENKIIESQNGKPDKNTNDSSISNPFVNFTLVSPSNQQNNIKLQNGSNRKIYLPAEIKTSETNGVLDGSDTSETNDFNDISAEFQSIFEKAKVERKIENGAKISEELRTSSDDKRNDLRDEISDHKIPQPQLISITCSQTSKSNTGSTKKDTQHHSPGIKVSVVNGTNSHNETLDFGESSLNSFTNELQTEDINECYNVKLDAPEEVIVAGFHDFCHTMLSLEESLESHDTGTVKRRKIKPKPTVSEEKKNTEELGSKIFNNTHEPNSSHLIKQIDITKENINGSFEKEKSSNEHSSDKLLEEIQNSKLLEKMNIKDPDVIDAITALDNSLREASEQPILSQKELKDIESGLLITKHEMFSMEAKRRSNVVKEDKIQSDNLIEEILLEKTSKRVLNAHKKAPPPPKRESCIAVTISNSNAQHLSSIHTHNTQIHNLADVKERNITSDRRINNVEYSTFNEVSVEPDKLSDYCLSAGNTKRINVMSDAKDDVSSLPVSISSDEANPTLPLQVSVDNNATAGLQDVVACNRTSPCSVDSGTSSHNQSYFVVVAIDFGTTYSGYAFSFTRDPDNIHMMKKWDGGDPGVSNQKTPTTLLLSPDGTFHSFGFSARDYYHDLDVEEAKGWLYFEKFKMTLHHNEHLSLDTEIAAANGKRMPAVTVFAHALRYFKDHALQELSDQSATRILNEDVRWVVTVPAIWKQPAKQFMRAAAYKAGIASPEFPDQLLIALEPEAASIYCRRMRLHQLVPEETQYQRSLQWQKDRDTESEIDSTMSEKDLSFPASIGQGGDGSFTVGTRYMVVDCGGGTVDITVHELLDKQGTLKELQKASGGPYGSMGVDMEFENLLCDIFGKDFMQQFKATRPTGYVDLMIAFEARKRNASPYKNNPLNISLPFSFIEYYKKYKGSSVETAIKKSSHKNVKWSQGMLRLEPSAMEALFQKTVEQIRRHIEDIISQEDLCIDYIFLVGGFAESLILQKEIKEAFSSKLKVVIPQGVSLAILKGAVLFGLDPTTVNIRRLRMTYGVGVLTQFIHGVHPREKLVIKNGKQWCADVFDKFVVNEQSVGVGDVVVRRYTPAKDGQSCSVIHIYCSEKDNVYFITDPGVKRCATLILDLSDSRYIQSREIQTRMMFGDTEIKVSALDVTTGKCVKAEVDFLNH